MNIKKRLGKTAQIGLFLVVFVLVAGATTALVIPKQTLAGGTIFIRGLTILRGNFGFNNTNPTHTIDVGGDIHATGDICTDAGGGKCLSTVSQPSSESTFGGIYTKNKDGSCRYKNPFTGSCSCGDGYTAQKFNEFVAGQCQFYQDNVPGRTACGVESYFCYVNW